MWWVWVIGLGSIYFFLSRAIIVFYYAVRGEDWRTALTGDTNYVPIYVPVAGELWFLYIIFLLTFYHPLVWIGNSGEWINNKSVERVKRKAEVAKNHKAYLDNLSKYGLTPKDIPAYVKEPAALKEYLAAWQKVNA